MSDFYTEMQGVASDLLREFDQTRSDAPASVDGNGIFYIAVTPGTGPRDRPGPAVETPYKVDAVARGVAFKYVDNTNVVVTDQQTTMAVHPDFTPAIGGFVVVDGARHKVIQVIRKPAAGVPVAYTLIFRK